MKLLISVSVAFIGDVMTIQCSRDGDVRWSKDVYVKKEETEQFYAKYLMKRVGVFLYDVVGNTKGVMRKPKGVPDWKEF